MPFRMKTTGRGRIVMHRSLRHVRFNHRRLGGWLLVALVATGLQLYFHSLLIHVYGATLERLLTLARVPFEHGPVDRLSFIAIPSWSVETFNPVAMLPGALAYGLGSLVLTLVVWRIPVSPFPLTAWVSLLGALLLGTTLVLSLRPVPRFTPEVFSGMWLKVAVATALVFPWFWALLVGVLPLPVPRVAFWGTAAWILWAVWNVCRLALFLALARAAGVIWLPMAFMLGCTLMDCLVFVTAFSRVLESAGQEWAEPA